MKHLIDKSALVAEIERRKKEWSYGSSIEAKYKVEAYKELMEWLDTLEVKEVDLNFMLHEYWNLSSKITIDCLESATMTKDEMITFAKHFFELGLKAQKGE